MNASKRVPQLLDAFARFTRPIRTHACCSSARPPGLDLDWRIEHAGLRDAVVREDYVDEQRLWALIAGVDASRRFARRRWARRPATAIRALSLGKPLVVSDVGWFSELPDEVALKVGRRARDRSARAALEAARVRTYARRWARARSRKPSRE